MSDKPKGNWRSTGRPPAAAAKSRSWPSTRRFSTWPRPSTSSSGPAPPTARSATSRRWPTAAIDVCLFNGGIRTSEQEYMAQLMRRKSKVLVAFGSCASEGCIPGLANMNTPQADLRHGLQGRLGHRAGNPQDVRPQHRDEVPEGTLHLPVFYDTLKTLDQTVDVDYYLPGCPPEAENIWNGHRGDPRRQAAAEGLGDRREHDRLRRVHAEAEREEDQEVLSHLADHPRRRDVPVGAGPVVLRHRHPGGLRGALPAVNSPCIGCHGAERRRGRLRRPADERRGLGDRLATTRTRSTGSSTKAFPTRWAVSTGSAWPSSQLRRKKKAQRRM